MLFPQDLSKVVSELDAADREAVSIVGSLDDARVNWQPDGGRRWIIAQCLDHLARANSEYLAPLGEALRRAREQGRLRRGAVAPGLVGSWFERQLEPPPRLTMRAPRAIQPASAIPRDEALAGFLASQDAVRRLLVQSADLDLSVRFANPFVPGLRFRAAAGFRIVAAHDRRHLWQARRVLEALAFPRSVALSGGDAPGAPRAPSGHSLKGTDLDA
jgi:hypothetical protein